MFCTNCGQKISKDDAFCPFCGERVVQEETDNSVLNDEIESENCKESNGNRAEATASLAENFETKDDNTHRLYLDNNTMTHTTTNTKKSRRPLVIVIILVAIVVFVFFRWNQIKEQNAISEEKAEYYSYAKEVVLTEILLNPSTAVFPEFKEEYVSDDTQNIDYDGKRYKARTVYSYVYANDNSGNQQKLQYIIKIGLCFDGNDDGLYYYEIISAE